MRILRVIANMAARYGGPQTACVGLSEALSERGHDVQVLTTNQDGDDVLPVPLGYPIRKNGVTYRYYNVHFPRFWSSSFGLGRALLHYIPTVDIVHVHNLYLYHTWLACSVARKTGIPYVVTPHGALMSLTFKHHRFRKSIIEKLYELGNLAAASAVHFASEQEFKESQLYVSPHNGVVIPWGISMNQTTNVSQRKYIYKCWPHFADSVIIMFLGRIHQSKGIDVLFRALKTISQNSKNVHLALVGLGEQKYVNSLKVLAESLKISNHITWCGMMTGKMKNEMLHLSDICVLPSRVDSFGHTVLESMAAGTPLVVSDQVGLAEEVRRSGAGLVTQLDPESCAGAICRILHDKNLSEDMSRRGPLYAAEHYDWARSALKFEQLYESLLK